MPSKSIVICPQCHLPFKQQSTRQICCSKSCSRLLRFGDEDARFWSKVDRTGGEESCWDFTGGKTPKGYGTYRYQGEIWIASRVAWVKLRGPIPDGLWVLHNCPGGDNPSCVNPDHLWLGTSQDNIDDMWAKGRGPSGERSGSRLHPEAQARGERSGRHTHPERTARGERSGSAKLTENEVREMRALHEHQHLTFTALGAMFGVHKVSARMVVRRETWKHVA